VSPTPATSSLTVAEVARIAAIRNRVIRNLEITHCYWQLAQAMRARTVPAANWCTFATWASRQAGSTIRGEDLIANFRRKLGEKARLLAPLQSVNRLLLRKGMFEPDTRLGRVVAEVHTPFDAFERASEAVAQGNLKVFDEIGREFARFVATVPADARAESDELRAFIAGLRSGPPPDGQDCLRDAFTHYQQQRHEADPAAREAWLLLANLKIGLHEQTRLQPQIAAALDAPLSTAEDLGAGVLHALVPASRSWSGAVTRPTAAVSRWLAKPLRRTAVQVAREAITEAMMVLALPDRLLALGHDLDARVPAVFGDPLYPPLGRLVADFDSCPPGGMACGAEDWSNLRQRMHYIVHLFRAFAQDASLYSPPFTDGQVARFHAGVVPDGRL
jgi:hypothetical protein